VIPMIAWATHRVMTSASITHPFCVISCLGQEIVSGAEHRYKQQLEVGEHRGSSLESAVTESTTDFDLCAYVPFLNPAPRPRSVELLI
jgi:hypothetical protein